MFFFYLTLPTTTRVLKATLTEGDFSQFPAEIAREMEYVWSGEKFALNNHSSKTEQIKSDVQNLFERFNRDEISVEELYQQVGERLYPEEFTSAKSKTDNQAESAQTKKTPRKAELYRLKMLRSSVSCP